MLLVAIHPTPADAAVQRADALCGATGLSRYETRTRLRVLDGLPGVLATFATEADAAALVQALRREGLRAWTMPGQPTEARIVVRRFTLDEAGMRADCEGGTSIEVADADVRLLLHGVALTVSTENTIAHDGGAAVGRNAARIILGLPPAHRQARAVTIRHESRESFLHLYAIGHPALVFRASSLQYVALDDGRVQPTRVANFARVVDRLRERFGDARFDARLTLPAQQRRLLGPTLRPERDLDVAIALLTRELRDRDDPYR